MTDQQHFTAASSVDDSPRSALREAALEAKAQAGVLAEQATSKAREIYRQSKDMAEQRAGEAREAIVERPWAAAGLLFLAGLVIGHALIARRPPVIYLQDRRPPLR